jgi:hypothetical protein
MHNDRLGSRERRGTFDKIRKRESVAKFNLVPTGTPTPRQGRGISCAGNGDNLAYVHNLRFSPPKLVNWHLTELQLKAHCSVN